MSYTINVYGAGTAPEKVRAALEAALAVLSEDAPDETEAKPHGGFVVEEEGGDGPIGLVRTVYTVAPTGDVLQDTTLER